MPVRIDLDQGEVARVRAIDPYPSGQIYRCDRSCSIRVAPGDYDVLLSRADVVNGRHFYTHGAVHVGERGLRVARARPTGPLAVGVAGAIAMVIGVACYAAIAAGQVSHISLSPQAQAADPTLATISGVGIAIGAGLSCRD